MLCFFILVENIHTKICDTKNVLESPRWLPSPARLFLSGCSSRLYSTIWAKMRRVYNQLGGVHHHQLQKYLFGVYECLKIETGIQQHTTKRPATRCPASARMRCLFFKSKLKRHNRSVEPLPYPSIYSKSGCDIE